MSCILQFKITELVITLLKLNLNCQFSLLYYFFTKFFAYFLRSAVEASRRQLSLTEPPAQQVCIHLVQLTSKRQEAGAAVNLKYQPMIETTERKGPIKTTVKITDKIKDYEAQITYKITDLPSVRLRTRSAPKSTIKVHRGQNKFHSLVQVYGVHLALERR